MSLTPADKPLALVVFLENVGHIADFTLPCWMMAAIDWMTEEYAKFLLRQYGAYRRYDRVIVLEDEQATGPSLADALQQASHSHQVDLLLLVHGRAHILVGWRGREMVDCRTFDPLLRAYQKNPSLLDLRMVFGLNCFGATLAPTWLALGAQVSNGAVGVNWFPEPILSVFLRNWLGGRPYTEAVGNGYRLVTRLGALKRLGRVGDRLRAGIRSSRPIIYGRRDLTIDG